VSLAILLQTSGQTVGQQSASGKSTNQTKITIKQMNQKQYKYKRFFKAYREELMTKKLIKNISNRCGDKLILVWVICENS
jgi:predicted transcriptional regulator YheO